MTAPAQVMTEGGRVTGHLGQTVTVTCEATGDEPLTLTWHNQHSSVSSDHRHVSAQALLAFQVLLFEG